MSSQSLFHLTRDPQAILAAGFVNGDGAPGLGPGNRVGVLLTGALPAEASGGWVLAVVFPDSVGLSDHEIPGRPGQWCVPAEVVNSTAQVRLLSGSEIDAVRAEQASPE